MSHAVLANYHSHTARCRHASGTEEEYINAAIQSGITVLGFSDHTPWPFATPGYVSRCRMLPEELPDYVSTLRTLQKKYAGQIKIYIGLEAEYYPDYLDWLKQQVQAYALDYLIFGNHFHLTEETGIYFGNAVTDTDIGNYVDTAIAGMETGIYRYLAHPDLFLNSLPAFDRAAQNACHAICEAAAATGTPLEYNMLGADRIRRGECRGIGYTNPLFWEIAKRYPIRAIVGSDAHLVRDAGRGPDIQSIREMLRQDGISVMDTLPGLE